MIMEMANGNNILMLFAEPKTSHFHDAAIIAAILKDRGHNVSFLLPTIEQNDASALSKANAFNVLQIDQICAQYEFVDVVNLLQEITIQSGTFDVDIVHKMVRVIEGIILTFMHQVQSYLCDAAIMDLMLSSKFDLAVLEGSFLWLHGITHKLDIPYVTLTTTSTSSITNTFNHAPNLPAILPSYLMPRHHRKPMPFLWRVANAVNIIGQTTFFWSILDWVMVAAASEYASEDELLIPPTKSFGQANVWLTNSDFTTDVPRPFLPNTALVGGLSIQKPDALSKEFQEIADNAGQHGILVVSMGTVVEGLSQEQVNVMANVFARLPQIVVWKEPLPRPTFIGNNTIFRKWIPQNGLLDHPSTRAMVYHCGNNGAFEALYHGIPIIAIPVFGDQFDVAYRVMSNGMGLVVPVSKLKEETLFDAVSEVITNNEFKERAGFLSSVYRDNPDPAPERAAYWVEYVLRHGGNRLMRAKVADMDMVQEYLLDVWTFLITLSISLVLIMKSLMACCIRKKWTAKL